MVRGTTLVAAHGVVQLLVVVQNCPPIVCGRVNVIFFLWRVSPDQLVMKDGWIVKYIGAMDYLIVARRGPSNPGGWKRRALAVVSSTLKSANKNFVSHYQIRKGEYVINM